MKGSSGETNFTTAMKSTFLRQSLARQFLLVSFPVMLAGSLVIGWWIGKQVEEGAVHRIGTVTALYVDAFVGPHVQELAKDGQLTPGNIAALDTVLKDTLLGQKVLSLKVWNPSGRVLYSTDPSVIGKQFAIEEGLEVAISGSIFSEISIRTPAEQIEHGQPFPRLIETYTPIHEDRTGRVIAVAEFYERPEELDRLAGHAQRISWARIAAIMIAMYACLYILVRRGSKTIANQSTELSEQVQQLTELNEKNLGLQIRLIDAAERTTAINENFLQRVSADLHDGPGQDLGFALMQIKNMTDSVTSGALTPALSQPAMLQSLSQICRAIESAVKDLRGISADIELPDIERLRPTDIAARVVRDLQSKTGGTVEVDLSHAPELASFRTKVALYRLLQESLANTVRHAHGRRSRLVLSTQDDMLIMEVSDQGPGFDVHVADRKGRLGLRGMRQRVEVLGGEFELRTAPGAGTYIRITLPLTSEVKVYEQ